MPIRDGQQAVRNVTEAGGTRTAEIPAELHPLLSEVHHRATEYLDCYLSCRDNKGEHCLAYLKTSHEIGMWHIGLMFVEYVAGLLIDKAGIGHCYAENKTNPRCSFSRAMHEKMLAELKNDLRKLADEIEALEAAERAKWLPAEPHPTPP